MRAKILLGVLLMTGGVQAQPLPDIDELWDYADPAGTQARFLAMLPRAEASDDKPYQAELLSQIARTWGLQREFDSAHAILDRVEAMLPELGARPRVRYLLERGRTLNSSGEPKRADPLFVEAWDLARESGLEFLAVDAAHMVAIVKPGDASLDWNRKAIAYAETATESRARNWLGSLYNNTGWSYFELETYDSALTMFESAVAFRETQAKPREILVARWCVAKCQRYLGRVDEALQTQRELEVAWEDLGEPDGYVYEEIGECLLLLDQEDESRPYFRRAFELLSTDPWLQESEPERLQRLEKLSVPR